MNKNDKMGNNHKLRILFSSNAPWASSGYGQQARDLLPKIRDEGYPLACVCFFGLEGHQTITLDGITCYPRIGDIWGVDAIVNHGKDFKADVTITLQDTWVMDPKGLAQTIRWTPIVPIDHEPAPPAVIQRMNFAYRIISYSKFGKKQLENEGFSSTYIPHAVNTKIFKPYPQDQKMAMRQQLGIPPDMFLFGMVAANKDNPPRKSFQEAMDAFVEFHKHHPNSGMYFHTLFDQQGGFPIAEYAKFLGIGNVVFRLEPYEQLFKVGHEDMPKIYNTFDCLLAPSTNEGFGVPLIEAQACGIPVITNNYTAMPELIIPNKTGYLCRVMTRRFTPLLSYIGVPDPLSIYENMEHVFQTNREKMGKAAREHIVAHYELDMVFSIYWKPFLEQLERELYPA